MNENQKKDYVDKLYTALIETKEQIEELTEAAKPIAPDNAIGRVSRMDAINNKTFADRGLREAKMKLKRINSILDRKDKKEFGHCVKCGDEILFKRLMYMPDTLICVSCARKDLS